MHKTNHLLTRCRVDLPQYRYYMLICTNQFVTIRNKDLSRQFFDAHVTFGSPDHKRSADAKNAFKTKLIWNLYLAKFNERVTTLLNIHNSTKAITSKQKNHLLSHILGFFLFKCT